MTLWSSVGSWGLSCWRMRSCFSIVFIFPYISFTWTAVNERIANFDLSTHTDTSTQNFNKDYHCTNVWCCFYLTWLFYVHVTPSKRDGAHLPPKNSLYTYSLYVCVCVCMCVYVCAMCERDCVWGLLGVKGGVAFNYNAKLLSQGLTVSAEMKENACLPPEVHYCTYLPS